MLVWNGWKCLLRVHQIPQVQLKLPSTAAQPQIIVRRGVASLFGKMFAFRLQLCSVVVAIRQQAAPTTTL